MYMFIYFMKRRIKLYIQNNDYGMSKYNMFRLISGSHRITKLY